MLKTIKWFTFSLLITSFYNINAQIGKVFVKSNISPSPMVQLKWYHKDITAKEGVNIYKKEAGPGAWKKINKLPVKMMNAPDPDAVKKDSLILVFAKILNEHDVTTIPGMVLLNILVKSFENNEFARFAGIYYEDKDIVPGKNYQYQVKRIIRGVEFEVGTSDIVKTGETTVLAPPQKIKIKQDTLKVKFKWEEEPLRFYGVDIYKSYSPEGLFVKRNINPIMPSERADRDTAKLYHYVDDSVSQGNTYYFKLVGKGLFGDETEHSEVFKMAIRDMIPPAAVQNLRRKIKNPVVNLYWAVPKDKDIAGLHVYRSSKSEGPFTRISVKPLTARDTTYSDRVNKSGPYYYYVATFDAAGNEKRSDPTFAEVHDIVPPAKPMGLTCKADTGFIHLNWTPNKEPDVMGYLIYRTITKNSKEHFVLVNSDPVTMTGFTEKLPKNAKNRFLYKIIAIDSSYNKSPFSDIATARMPDIFPPAAPAIKKINLVKEGLEIEWVPNADPDLKGYMIYKKEEEKQEVFALLNKELIKPGDTKFTDKNCTPGKSYRYYMVAIDSVGNKSYNSGSVLAFIPVNDIPLQLDKKMVKVEYNKQNKSVNINWSYPETMGVNNTIIYKKRAEESLFMPLGPGLTVSGFNDKNIKKGENYIYLIKAYSATGSFYSSVPYNILIE